MRSSFFRRPIVALLLACLVLLTLMSQDVVVVAQGEEGAVTEEEDIVVPPEEDVVVDAAEPEEKESPAADEASDVEQEEEVAEADEAVPEQEAEADKAAPEEEAEADEVVPEDAAEEEEETLPVHHHEVPPKEEFVAIHQQPGVVALNDETFEHQTQASTGQTTGSWLVYFHTPNDRMSIRDDYPSPDVWSEHHVVLAAVNFKEGGMETAKRFDVRQIPSFLYFHKGKLYRYKKPPGGYAWSDLLAFTQDPSSVVDAEDIPGPPSMFKHLQKQMSKDPTLMMLSVGLVVVVVLAVLVSSLAGSVGPAKEKSA